MRLFGAERLQGVVSALNMPEDMPIDAKILSGAIENAQKRIEENNFKRRKYVLAYDDVMNQQRTIIYKQRQDVLNGEDISETVCKMLTASVRGTVETYLHGDETADWSFDGLRAHYLGLLTEEDDFCDEENHRKHADRDAIADMLCERALKKYAEKEELFGSETFREVERAILLRNVDTAWMEHIDIMDELKSTVGLQSYAQRDPITEYRIQGADMFDAMVEDIRNNTVRGILSVMPRPQAVERVQVAKPISEGFGGNGDKKKIVIRKPAGVTVIKDGASVGRNDPCPCGSGKKYKNCCLRAQNQN